LTQGAGFTVSGVRIGELAARTGATAKALRYYERLGVLEPARGGNGYRAYRDADVRVVEVVRSLGRLGISVDRCGPFLECLEVGHDHPDECVASLATYRTAIAELTERIDALSGMRSELVRRLERAAARTPVGNLETKEPATMEYQGLPSYLPRPEDDGAADHLLGATVRHIVFRSTDGQTAALDEFGPSRTVLYVYPLSGRPGVDLPDGWDAIPGVRGCTPEACGFRDHHSDLRAAGVSAVFGLSSQSAEYQAEFAQRLGLPFAILSDPSLGLADALGLPTFSGDENRLYKRLTLVLSEGRVEHAFYPIFPPDQHAEEVLDWLRAHPTPTMG
jgi:peroxiredoxin/DNA-binding transcriptional MerR regulator